MQILAIEDDPAMGKTLHAGLREAGHGCVLVRDGRAGLDEALTQRFDAIVLDLRLPGLGGLEVLAAIRREGVRTPILLLTAQGSVEERVAGLDAGADDYLVKPFAFAELVARLHAVCRRVQDRPAAQMSAGELSLDLATRRVQHAGREIDLTPTEFSLLEMLMRHAGQVVTRKMLCEHLWEADWEGETNVIEVHVTRLRKKLDGAGEAIQTVRGRGYAFRASRPAD
jgi:two-component system OmpR family response regulator/two-component system copper resistance phosphate regulon response regulator CusR